MGLVSRVAVAAAAVAVAACALPGAASAAVTPALADLEGKAGLSAFNNLNTFAGKLAVTGDDAYTGARSASASYVGGGVNAYARGILDVGWKAGDDVWFRSAFRLPAGFKDAMQGQVALLRWDDYGAHPADADQGGIVLFGQTKQAYLVHNRANGRGGWDQATLVGPFEVPEGRWFQLEVHQRFGTSAAVNEVFLDGQRVGGSTERNLRAGRGIDRLRVGIVATAGIAQKRPLSLRFDDTAVATSGPAAPRAGAPTARKATASRSCKRFKTKQRSTACVAARKRAAAAARR